MKVFTNVKKYPFKVHWHQPSSSDLWDALLIFHFLELLSLSQDRKGRQLAEESGKTWINSLTAVCSSTCDDSESGN